VELSGLPGDCAVLLRTVVCCRGLLRTQEVVAALRYARVCYGTCSLEPRNTLRDTGRTAIATTVRLTGRVMRVRGSRVSTSVCSLPGGLGLRTDFAFELGRVR